MIWQELTASEINKLDRNIPVFLPIGAIEQHGDHLPVMTDSFIAKYFCNRIHQALTDKVLVLPEVAVCCSAHHMDFAGTLTVSHQTLMNYIVEILESVYHHGFKNIVILNAHGGNQSIASVIVEHFGVHHQDANIALATWWKMARKELFAITETELFGVGHACEFETSILQYIDAQIIRDEHIKKGKVNTSFEWAAADLLRGSKAMLHRTMKQHTESGVYGDPTAASKEKGERIVEAVLPELIQIAKDMYSFKQKTS